MKHNTSVDVLRWWVGRGTVVPKSTQIAWPGNVKPWRWQSRKTNVSPPRVKLTPKNKPTTTRGLRSTETFPDGVYYYYYFFLLLPSSLLAGFLLFFFFSAHMSRPGGVFATYRIRKRVVKGNVTTGYPAVWFAAHNPLPVRAPHDDKRNVYELWSVWI